MTNGLTRLGSHPRLLRRENQLTAEVARGDDPAKQPANNLLHQDFIAEAPNRKRVTDITYLRTATGWIYLAVVLDLFSRKVVGWALSDSLATEVVQAALRMAIQTRSPLHGELLLHSDRGCQFTSDAFQRKLKLLGIACSMSRTGCCYDNAVMERFFWSLKHEWTNHQTFETINDARLSVFKGADERSIRARVSETLDSRSRRCTRSITSPPRPSPKSYQWLTCRLILKLGFYQSSWPR